MNNLYRGECLTIMRDFESNTFDTLITDPPYGLSFMGKKWDYDVPGVDVWRECLRVLKPGATALIFAGSRTQHRMAINVEDAGFILKDTIMWIYGSGFPKSTDISKQIDKANGKHKIDLSPFGNWIKSSRKKLGYSRKELDNLMGTNTAVSWWEGRLSDVQLPNLDTFRKLKSILNLSNKYDYLIEWAEAEREVIGKLKNPASAKKDTFNCSFDESKAVETIPATTAAVAWNGWGTALKPAYEPILVCQKPNDGTYAQNALKHGVSGLNIDGGRVEGEKPLRVSTAGKEGLFNMGSRIAKGTTNQGRFPANIILDPEAGRLLDEQSGIGTSHPKDSFCKESTNRSMSGKNYARRSMSSLNDTGGASRFFYTAKASKSERNAGCAELIHFYRIKPEVSKCATELTISEYNNLIPDFQCNFEAVKGNIHPTVKSLSLMTYLCDLTKTPTGGTVLDPFAGSGTTGVACIRTGREYILIEQDEISYNIATARLLNQ